MFTTAAFFVVISICVLPQDITAQADCKTLRRNSGPGKALTHWDFQCDDDGNFLPFQCTNNRTGPYCACFSEKGLVSIPSTSTKSCECNLVRNEALQSQKPACEIPECQINGQYEKKQCCVQTKQCRCVDETTGETTVSDTDDMDLTCP
ncbi:uncharacterized protein TNCV_2802161 [Trichonephila clavipes]|nr:uncharacterized protein TNCV_2802161 [Trichonephila clavipes]